jgi:hypothetical protein
MNMFRATLRLLCPLLLTLVAGCHGVSVDTTHADGVDFTQLRTYDWLSLPETSPTAARDQTVVGVLATTLEKKGLQRSQTQPDLLVAVHRTIEGTLSTTDSGYEWRNGRLKSYPLQQGSLVIDMVLPKTKEVVWRGTASGAFRADQTAVERSAFLTDLMTKMFADYPPRN